MLGAPRLNPKQKAVARAQIKTGVKKVIRGAKAGAKFTKMVTKGMVRKVFSSPLKEYFPKGK